jgi:hypothetical protein
MSTTKTRVGHPIYNLLPSEMDGFDSLAELALEGAVTPLEEGRILWQRR